MSTKIRCPLPVTHGEQYTKWHIFFYTLIMVATTLLPFASMSGWLYLAAAIAWGLGFSIGPWCCCSIATSGGQETFRYSILYDCSFRCW